MKKMINYCKFTDKIYSDHCSLASEAVNLTQKEYSKLKNNKIAKLVCALPYIAKAEYPDRIAFTHLLTLIIASQKNTKKIFLHTQSDDANIFSRLERISHFPGADPRIVKKRDVIAGFNNDQ